MLRTSVLYDVGPQRQVGVARLPMAQEMIGKMRQACGLAAEALALACDVAKVGVTTDEAGMGRS